MPGLAEGGGASLFEGVRYAEGEIHKLIAVIILGAYEEMAGGASHVAGGHFHGGQGRGYHFGIHYVIKAHN